nr:hypothetical protein [Tanacetum cinerariifolium]
MRRVGKGFFRVETPLFEGMLIEQEIGKGGDAEEHVQNVTDDDVAQGDDTAAYGELPTVTQEPSIPSPTPPTSTPQPPQDIPSTSQALEIKKLKRRVKKLEKENRVKVLKQRRSEELGPHIRLELVAACFSLFDSVHQPPRSPFLGDIESHSRSRSTTPTNIVVSCSTPSD